MNAELLKLISPVVYLFVWVAFVRRHHIVSLAGPALFFTGVVALSQNFSFVYRELFQGLQILLVMLLLLRVLKRRSIGRFNIPVLLFLSFILLSLAFSEFDQDGRSQLINFLVAIGVTNYIFESINTRAKLAISMGYVGRLAFVASIFGFFEFFLDSSSRIEATFSNSNYYAFFLGLGYCASFASTRGWWRIVVLSCIIFSIILSGSRSALLFPVAHFLWQTFCDKGIVKFLGALVGIGALGALLILSGSTRLGSDSSEGSDAERLIFAEVALRMANDHPVLGVGWGRYITEFGNYSSSSEQILTSTGEVDATTQDRRVTHNDLLRVLAELGWIAFFLSIIGIAFGFFRALRNRERENYYIFPMWLGCFAFSLTHNNMNGALFWIIILLPFVYLRRRPD